MREMVIATEALNNVLRLFPCTATKWRTRVVLNNDEYNVDVRVRFNPTALLPRMTFPVFTSGTTPLFTVTVSR